MKVKVSELSGVALDWAVAQAVGVQVKINYSASSKFIEVYEKEPWPGADDGYVMYSPSIDWGQCGPLIATLFVAISGSKTGCQYYLHWAAAINDHPESPPERWYPGDTPLQAACRAIVSAKFGDEIDLPEGLV